jgi:hypothetical protein
MIPLGHFCCQRFHFNHCRLPISSLDGPLNRDARVYWVADRLARQREGALFIDGLFVFRADGALFVEWNDSYRKRCSGVV